MRCIRFQSFLIHTALSPAVQALPYLQAATTTLSTPVMTPRRLTPDVTVNILFSILSAFLAVATMVQAACLARAFLRARASQVTTDSTGADLEDRIELDEAENSRFHQAVTKVSAMLQSHHHHRGQTRVLPLSPTPASPYPVTRSHDTARYLLGLLTSTKPPRKNLITSDRPSLLPLEVRSTCILPHSITTILERRRRLITMMREEQYQREGHG